MKKNKGFTLIELLAVIIVLAIIALIATPIVMNTIKNSKKNSALISGEAYIKQVGTTIMEDRLKNGKFINDGTYIINSDGNLTGNGLEEPFEIPMSGKKPSSGYITIKNGQVESESLIVIDNYEVEYDEDQGNYIASEFDASQPDYLNAFNDTCYVADGSISDYSFLQGPMLREQIEKIEFMTSSEVPSDAIGSWVVSRRGEVMAWYKDEDNDDLYEVYIGQNGGVKANPNSSKLLAGLSITSLDLKNLDTSDVTDMSYMFENDRQLETIIFGDSFDTSKVTNMSSMFSGCHLLKKLNLSNFDTSKVTNMRGMFYFCSSLASLDLSNFNTSKVTDMQAMFSDCHSLTSLGVSVFDTSNVTNMSYMFDHCKSLTSLEVSNFDTSNVTNMSDMFYYCKSLTSLEVSNFNTSKVTIMSSMFQSCESLIELDVSNFDTSNVTGMSGMFRECSSLTELNLSNFDTSKLVGMSEMFYGASRLENISLDKATFANVKVSVWNTSDVFNGCVLLKTIKVYDDDARTFIKNRLKASNKTGVTVEVVG